MLARCMLSPVHLSVCLSVTRVDQSKTVEVKIMKFSPYGISSSFCRISFIPSGASKKGGVGKTSHFL